MNISRGYRIRGLAGRRLVRKVVIRRHRSCSLISSADHVITPGFPDAIVNDDCVRFGASELASIRKGKTVIVDFTLQSEHCNVVAEQRRLIVPR